MKDSWDLFNYIMKFSIAVVIRSMSLCEHYYHIILVQGGALVVYLTAEEETKAQRRGLKIPCSPQDFTSIMASLESTDKAAVWDMII